MEFRWIWLLYLAIAVAAIWVKACNAQESIPVGKGPINGPPVTYPAGAYPTLKVDHLRPLVNGRPTPRVGYAIQIGFVWRF